MMKNEFVPHKEAIALKELGFNEKCIVCYFEGELRLTTAVPYLIYELEDNSWRRNSDFTNSVTAPLYQQVFRWFREKHGFNSYIIESVKGKYYFNIAKWNDRSFISPDLSKTYDKARYKCLKKLIEYGVNNLLINK